MNIANAVWLATAQLHRENGNATDFSVQQILERATRENLIQGFRPGLQVHVSKHCVANKSPNPGRYRMLYETTRGRRRLFKEGDAFHADRLNGKIRPEKRELPPEYQPVVDWYDTVYSKQEELSDGRDLANANRLADAREAKRSSPQVSVEPAIQGAAYVSSAGAFKIPESLRKELHIQEGTLLSIYREQDRLVLQPVTKEFISSLVGCCKGEDSLVEALKREHRMEK
jgi:bifunctional DNA-binding transcriptional regulator/antitoxin component of YhaV-PrlF toxin-antitoxin module